MSVSREGHRRSKVAILANPHQIGRADRMVGVAWPNQLVVAAGNGGRSAKQGYKAVATKKSLFMTPFAVQRVGQRFIGVRNCWQSFRNSAGHEYHLWD